MKTWSNNFTFLFDVFHSKRLFVVMFTIIINVFFTLQPKNIKATDKHNVESTCRCLSNDIYIGQRKKLWGCQQFSSRSQTKKCLCTNLLISIQISRHLCHKQCLQIAFLPEACDYLADNKADAVSMAESLDGSIVQRYKELALKEDMWLSLGGVHEAVCSTQK